MAITEGQYQIGDLVIGRGTEYHVTAVDQFSWPTNRSGRRNKPGQDGYDFDPLDLFSGRNLSIDMIINSTDLVAAQRAISQAARQTTPDTLVDVLLWTTRDSSPKLAQGRTRQLLFPGYDRTTYSGSCQCKIVFETERSYLMSAEPKTSVVNILDPGDGSGRDYPRTYPRVYGLTLSGGYVTLVNDGDGPTDPVFVIYGPAVNPTIEHTNKGVKIRVNVTLASDEFLVIDVMNATVMLNGTASRYAFMSADSEMFKLDAGSNQLLFTSTSYLAGAELHSTWYDAFFV